MGSGYAKLFSAWRLNSYNLNLKEQSQTGDFLAQMDGDLPGLEANAVNVGYVCHHQRAKPSSLTRTVNLNVRSSILQGASMPIISGGEFNSFGGDYNRITINICKTLASELRFLFKSWYLDQGVQRHRDDRHESVSSLLKNNTSSAEDLDKFIQSSTLHRGQRNPRRGTTLSTNAYFITTLSSNFLGQIIVWFFEA